MPSTNCLKCGQPVSVFTGEPGEQVRCGGCGHRFAMPEEHEPPPSAQATPVPSVHPRPGAVPSLRSVAPAAQPSAAAPLSPSAAPLPPVPVAPTSPQVPAQLVPPVAFASPAPSLPSNPQQRNEGAKSKGGKNQTTKIVLGIVGGFFGLVLLLGFIGAVAEKMNDGGRSSGSGSGGSSGKPTFRNPIAGKTSDYKEGYGDGKSVGERIASQIQEARSLGFPPESINGIASMMRATRNASQHTYESLLSVGRGREAGAQYHKGRSDALRDVMLRNGISP